MSSTAQPSWRQVGQHVDFPQATQDEVARFDFLTRLNVHLSQAVLPGVKLGSETCVKPAFEAEHGRALAALREADLDALLTQSGFPSGAHFETTMKAKTNRRLFPAPSGSEGGREGCGRSPSWTAFGAAKPQGVTKLLTQVKI